VKDKAKTGLQESGLHKEGRRRFGGILSLLLRYVGITGLASGKHPIAPYGVHLIST
jgi:hypothetical protein